MTPVTSAGLPRPPSEQLPRPPGPPRPGLGRSASHVISPLARRPSSTLHRQLSDFAVEDRPAKRRKVETRFEDSQPPVVEDGSGPPSAATSEPENVERTAHWRWAKPSAIRKWAEAETKVEKTEAQQSKSGEDKLPEMPPRPWRATQLPRVEEDPKPTHRSRINVPVPNLPDSIDMPSTAPHFVPRKPAGFFPWTGMHPEDSLSEANIKTGFFDKPPQNPEKELNSARVSLYNAFKHKSGVDSLSLLFSLVLDQKSQHGGMSSVSTFKPPPRVTLTEIKRRAWISDLANPGVSLRRLSRTIPQGIRGQALLDQCLESSVPLSRAIWFAKCVCANEIRTLKRKGTAPAIASGTEVKWLREWTVSVEQFLESNLASNESPNWKPSIQYALRLTTRLYMENLLDRDHYLDWILRSFESAEAGRTPFWLMVVQIYKVDLSYYRKRGTRLVRSLLEKYQALNTAEGQAPAAVTRQRLRAALRELLFARPNAFLLPDSWHDTAKIVRGCLDLSNSLEGRLFDQLQRMNQRSIGYDRTRYASTKQPETNVVEILDSARLPYDLPVLDVKLVQACPDRALLVRTCLGWASTRFRSSSPRIYIVARLIKRWQKSGVDTDTYILNYLSDHAAGRTTAAVAALRKLVAQLSRSDCFPVSRYIQWLMVRGLPRSQHQSAAFPDEPMAIHFLQDLSLHKAEAHVANLRNTVLERAGFDPSYEEVEYQKCESFVEERLQRLGSVKYQQITTSVEPAYTHLSWTARMRISTLLRLRAVEASRVKAGTPSLPGSKTLTETQYHYIRHVLESLDDEAILADIVGILSTSDNDDLVASLVATMHFHAEAFAAIGALEILHQQMCQVYLALRSSKPTLPLLTSSLLDLCKYLPTKSPAIRLLQQDLVKGDRGRAIAACSPYSDGIAESLQQAGATFIEDFEAILQSETNMNEQTMDGLFSVLVERIEKQQKFGDEPQTTLAFSQLLSRLRLCRKSQGDALIQNWLSKLLPRLDSKFGVVLLRALLATGCINFAILFGESSTAKATSKRHVASATLLYQILSRGHEDGLDWTVYQARIRWFEFVQTQPRLALLLVCDNGLQGLSPEFDDFLLSALVNETKPEDSSLSTPAQQWLKKGLCRLTGLQAGELTTGALRDFMQSLDTFAVDSAKRQLMLLSQDPTTNTSSSNLAMIVQVYYDILREASFIPAPGQDQDNQLALLLQIMPDTVANQLRHRLEGDFLEMLPKLPLGPAVTPSTAAFPVGGGKLTQLLDHAKHVFRSDTSASPGFIVQLVDRLSQHFKSLGTVAHTPVTPVTSGPAAIPGLGGSSQSPTTNLSVATSSSEASNMGDNNASPVNETRLLQFEQMLRMGCLQRPALLASGRSGPTTKQGQSEQVQVLVRLASIVLHPAMANVQADKELRTRTKELTALAFDLMATIVDDVNDDVRVMCARLLKDRLQDARVRHVFGSIGMFGSSQLQELGQGLQMTKEGRGNIGDWKPRVWEMLDNGSGKENETSLGLGLFGAKYEST
jgi:hypothetical protein